MALDDPVLAPMRLSLAVDLSRTLLVAELMAGPKREHKDKRLSCHLLHGVVRVRPTSA